MKQCSDSFNLPYNTAFVHELMVLLCSDEPLRSKCPCGLWFKRAFHCLTWMKIYSLLHVIMYNQHDKIKPYKRNSCLISRLEMGEYTQKKEMIHDTNFPISFNLQKELQLKVLSMYKILHHSLLPTLSLIPGIFSNLRYITKSLTCLHGQTEYATILFCLLYVCAVYIDWIEGNVVYFFHNLLTGLFIWNRKKK